MEFENINSFELVMEPGFFTPPKKNAVGRQIIKFDDTGLLFYSYSYESDSFASLKNTEIKRIELSEEEEKDLKDMVSRYFNTEYEEQVVYDAGTYSMVIKDEAGDTFCFDGPIIDVPAISETGKFSEGLRTITGINNLLALDGCPKRVTELIFNYESNYYGKKNKEELRLSRKDGKAYYHTEFSGNSVDSVFCMEQAVLFILDFYPWIDNMKNMDEMPSDFIIDPNKENKYTLTVTEGETVSVTGPYILSCLPTDFKVILDVLTDTLLLGGGNFDFLNPAIYERQIKREGQETYVMVRFGNYGRSYSYRTDGKKDYEPGDTVIVPVGDLYEFRTGKVAEIKYAFPDETLLPNEKLKFVAGLYDEDLYFAVGKDPYDWYESHNKPFNEESVAKGYAGAWNLAILHESNISHGGEEAYGNWKDVADELKDLVLSFGNEEKVMKRNGYYFDGLWNKMEI